jgi:hypothetical protein
VNNLNSIQSTIADLKEIVQRNQGANHETAQLVRQMETTVADIERKTHKAGITIVISPPVQPVTV